MLLRKESAVKLLFASVVSWQILQSFVTVRFEEPYPALTMPDFKGTMADHDGNIRFSDVKCRVVFRDGDVDWASTHDLLSAAPDSNRSLIMAHMFSPPSTTAAPIAVRSPKARWFPGRALSRERGAQKELDSQTKEWLKTRLQELYPLQVPEMATFIWYEEVFNVNRVPLVASLENAGVRHVQFP
jgi:hypothetical protein